MKKIVFTVTNDLTYDQRMDRICTALAESGYHVTLAGRKLRNSLPLIEKSYRQVRLNCLFTRGKLFYAEYNIRLFLWLLFRKVDALCAIDLDTILPCLFVSSIRRKKRVYDAHELFTGLKEVSTRKNVLRAWTAVEKFAVPKFRNGYTVSAGVADELNARYGVRYEVIRNVPVKKEIPEFPGEKQLIYIGAVNEARSFETLVPAMKNINAVLIVCGDGNFMPALKKLVEDHKVQNKIIFKGMLPPDQLITEAAKAYAGMAIAENEGLNQFLALPNKFFDYIHFGLPQVTMDFPEYRKINDKYEVAVLIPDNQPETIVNGVNLLLNDDVLYNRLRQNCKKAADVLNWENEKEILLEFYRRLFKQ